MKARIRFVEDEGQSQPRAISVGNLVATAWTRKWPRLVLGQSNQPKLIECTSYCLSPRSMKRSCKYDVVVRLSSSSSSVPWRAKFLEKPVPRPTGAKPASRGYLLRAKSSSSPPVIRGV